MLSALFGNYGSAPYGKVAASGMRLGFKHAAFEAGAGQLFGQHLGVGDHLTGVVLE